MKTVLSTAALMGILAAPATAHEIGNAPCGINSIGGLIMFGFDTFEPGLFTEACSAFGFLGVRGPGRPLSGALSRIW